MTKTEIIGIVDRAIATWGKTVTGPERKALYDAWFRLLDDLDADRVHAALDQLAVDTPQWMPTVGTVRRTAIDHADPDPPPSAAAAWEQFRTLTVAANTGTYQPVQLHPVVAATFAKLGPGAIGKDTNGDRDRFIATYEQALNARYRK